MNLNELIKKGESKILEFKKTLPSNEKVAITIAAFSNTAGGKLIIGIDDKRNIVGIDGDGIFELKDKIASIVFDNCHPNILPEIYTINIENKLVLVIEVPRGSLLPYFIKNKGKENGTYLRIGATNRKAGFENIRELERQSKNISYDEEIDPSAEFKDLDPSPLYDKFNDLGKPLNHDKLINLKLIKYQNGHIFPTNALLIILGAFQHTSVKCARFKGRTMEVFIDKKEYTKDIFSNLEDAVNFILNHINLRGEILGLQRTDTYEIPLVAIREAVINAFVHRDYSNSGRDIKVGVYDDVVNIVSPGGFPNTITQQDILNGRSEVRNKVIANVFKELSLIEQWGTGVAKMVAACKNHGLDEPAILEKGDFVDVEFFRPIGQSQQESQHELRPITDDYGQLNLDKKINTQQQQELRQELRQELQQEMKQESLFSKILSVIVDKPKSRKEISNELGQKKISGQLNEVLKKLQGNSLIEWTIPEIPKSSKQKFRITDKGKLFCHLVKNSGE